MTSLKAFAIASAVASVMLPVASLADGTVEVLHWWTSGGEAKAVGELKSAFEAQGGTWVDSPIAGGGGDAAMTALRARVVAGNPPSAVQLKGPGIQEWAQQGDLADINDVATSGKWDSVLPPVLATIMKYKGDYVAAPVNIHRVDWIWANPQLLAKVGVTAAPTTWDEFNAVADKLKAAGITPLANGSDPWQDLTLWDVIALGVGGPDFYKKAIIDLDPAQLTGDTMIKVFDQMRRMRGYVDAGYAGRSWDLATRMVMNGEAAMQIMGDWAKGEFAAAGKAPGKDFLCWPAPNQGGYILNSDSFAFFKVTGADKIKGQKVLAGLVMAPDFQRAFNLAKGSIPARTDVPLDGDLLAAISGDKLVPSLSQEMAISRSYRGEFLDVVTQFYNSDMSSADAVRQLAAAVARVKAQ